MDIVIHGTKGGRKIFTPNKLAGLLDVNSDSPKATAIGQKAYAIRFTEDKLIFSQYKIIRDVRGDKRTGFVGFSLFIQKNKKLKGSEIATLMDSVSDEYCQRYIADNNLSEVTENWDFLDIILSEYKTTPQLNEENFKSGVKDDAFIYFNGSEELKLFFDAPYQVEYQPFRQILFINKELEGKPENPLNALRNSGIDLTGKIDLENPKYKLIFNSNAGNGVRITVKANGATISNNNKFRLKNELEISWSKQYYKTEIQRGKCFELADKFINNDKEAGIVTIKEIELQPEEKTITFEIKDSLGNLINDAEILISNSLDDKFKPQVWEKLNSINFKGEDLGKSWIVTAKKGESLISDPHRIDFEKDCVGNVELILNEKIVLQIIAHKERLDGDIIDNIQTSKTIFTNNEINESHRITVTSYGYNSNTFNYLPSKDENPKHISLQKQNQSNQKIYKVSAGNHGKLNTNNNYSSNKSDGSDLDPNCVIPDKGWKFDCWRNDNDKLVAQYKKAPLFKRPIYIVASIVFVIAISFGIWKIIPNEKSEPLQIQVNSDSIINYLKGNELFEVKLNEYRNNWENHLREISQKQQDSIESISSEKRGLLSLIFGDVEDANNSYEQNMNQKDIFENDTILQKIGSAIILRESINALNFEYLKKQVYSEKQKKFKESIERVKISDYDMIRNRLTYKSEYTLNQIADSINTILDSKQKKTEQKNVEKAESKIQNNASKNVNNNGQSTKDNKNPTPLTTSQNDEIKNYLNGNELKLSKLEEYLKSNNSHKSSIKLCLDFWAKVKNSNQKEDFDKILKKINGDSNLNKSMLKDFLNSICASSDSFEKFKNMSGKAQLNTILKLKNKYENL